MTVACDSADNEYESDLSVADEQSDEDMLSDEEILEEFKALARSFNAEVMDLALSLSNVGIFHMNSWNALNDAGETVDHESMLERGFEWLEENNGMSREGVQNEFDRLSEKHFDLLDFPASALGGLDLQLEVAILFWYLESIHTTVTTPSGEVEDYAWEMSQFVVGITETHEELAELLS